EEDAMRNSRNRGKLPALAAGLLLLAGLTPGAAQETQPAQEQSPAQAFSFRVDRLVIGAIDTDVDTESSKFQEYRDLSSGFVLDFHLAGEGSGDRTFDLQADKA